MTHRATISKTFDFSASHHLTGLPEDHPCSRDHGHNYTVKLTISGYTDDVGFVIDYRALGWFKDYLDDTYDHRNLNKILDVNPTAENLAKTFLNVVLDSTRIANPDVLDRLTEIAVSVSETPKTWATVTSAKPWDLPLTPEEIDQDRYRWGTQP